MFAAGSYVAGDGGPLQPFSSSKFDIANSFCSIMHPDEVVSTLACINTVGLPYHIPEYEDECMVALHVILAHARMAERPYKAMLLELVLAGNGATLSNRALKMLAALAALHGIRFIVDEIMTAGRVSANTMLCSQTKPPEFQNRMLSAMLRWANGFLLELFLSPINSP